MEAVACAYHEKRQQLIDSEVETFLRTMRYPGGREAALRNAQERFSASLREDGFSSAPLDAVVAVMSGLCLAKVDVRTRELTKALRAEAIALCAMLPDDKPD